jgi:outer membrane protein TolC
MPLENRTARGNTRNGKLLNRQAVLNVKSLQDQITDDVTRAVRDLNTDLQRVRVAQNAEDLAVQQLRAAEARFREGLLSNIDLLIFQQQLATARSTTIRALVDAVKDGITVEADTGILLDTRRIVLDDYQRIPKDIEGPTQHPLIRDDG